MSNDLSPQIVKAVFKCDEKYKQEFSSSSCSLTISVGQVYHEGNKFLATIDLVNKHFKQCYINICDTHQRHTIAIERNISLDEAHEIARKNGDDWIQRNEVICDSLTIPFKTIRWDEWLTHKDYIQSLEEIEHLFQKDAFFQKQVQTAANLYLDRYRKRHKKDDKFYANMYNMSMHYLKEECAVMLLWGRAGYNFEIYPSERNLAMAATYELLINPNNPDVLKPVSLFLRTRSRFRMREDS